MASYLTGILMDGLIMDWTSIITALITGGAFTAIYLVGDRKSAAVMENVSKMIEQWKQLVEENKADTAELRDKIKIKDAKIDSLFKEIAVLRDKGDRMGSKIAYLTCYKCNRVSCADREPPFGSAKIERVEKDNES